MKARTVFKIIAIVGVPVTGYLSAKGSLKCEALLSQQQWALTNKEKAKTLAKSYWPAAVSGAVTIGSILIGDGLATKAIAAATASATLAVAKKDVLKGEFKKYREAVVEDGGKDKDVEYMKRASEIRLDADGEAIHRYKIKWAGEEIVFESTMGKVQEALNKINQQLYDYNTGSYVVTVSDALGIFDHPELRTKNTDRAGWAVDLLEVNCDCYWLDFFVYREDEGIGSHGDEDHNTFVIDVVWPPEDDISKALKQAEREGII